MTRERREARVEVESGLENGGRGMGPISLSRVAARGAVEQNAEATKAGRGAGGRMQTTREHKGSRHRALGTKRQPLLISTIPAAMQLIQQQTDAFERERGTETREKNRRQEGNLIPEGRAASATQGSAIGASNGERSPVCHPWISDSAMSSFFLPGERTSACSLKK
ncbi:unnamed protein product [Calypogeia fissa]